jgi:hypothetical protein
MKRRVIVSFWLFLLLRFLETLYVYVRSQNIQRANFSTQLRKPQALIHLAESETGLTKFRDLNGGYLYLVNQV